MASTSAFSSAAATANNHYEESESFLRPNPTAPTATDKPDSSSHSQQAATKSSHLEKKTFDSTGTNYKNAISSSSFNERTSEGPTVSLLESSHQDTKRRGPPVAIKPYRSRPNGPPPMAPPPPPPYFSSSNGGLTNSFPSRCYEAVVGSARRDDQIDVGNIDKRMRHKWMLGFAVVEAIFGALILMVGISCVVEVPRKCPYFTGCWVSAILIINGVVGVAAAITCKRNLIVAHLVLSTIAVVSAIILSIFSTIHWINTGWGWDLPSYCIWDRYTPAHIKHVYEKMRDYDFQSCVNNFIIELKLGSTYNSLLGSFGFFEIILCVVSVIFCFRRLCHCGYGYDLDD